MKTQKIMGWHRYQVFADDGAPACIIEMTPAITDEEKEALLEGVRKLTMRAPDACPYCAGKGVNHFGGLILKDCIHCSGTGQRR